MASAIPYMISGGSIGKILEKIKEIAVPEIFDQDFLNEQIGFNGGNYLKFIDWAKKCHLLNADGSPTVLYRQFRDPLTSGKSLAMGLQMGYAGLYARNQACHALSRPAFKSLVVEVTGDAKDCAKIEKIVSTFFSAKSLADFGERDSGVKAAQRRVELFQEVGLRQNEHTASNVRPNYTINLVLPETNDPAIYKAIFKSLKENLFNE